MDATYSFRISVSQPKNVVLLTSMKNIDFVEVGIRITTEPELYFLWNCGSGNGSAVVSASQVGFQLDMFYSVTASRSSRVGTLTVADVDGMVLATATGTSPSPSSSVDLGTMPIVVGAANNNPLSGNFNGFVGKLQNLRIPSTDSQGNPQQVAVDLQGVAVQNGISYSLF